MVGTYSAHLCPLEAPNRNTTLDGAATRVGAREEQRDDVASWQERSVGSGLLWRCVAPGPGWLIIQRPSLFQLGC